MKKSTARTAAWKERKADEVRELAARYGCKITEIGGGWLVTGPRTHMRVADLALVAEGDLR